MAEGRSDEHVVVQGKFGRTSPPPEGHILVRDPQVARANAIRRRADAHHLAGEKIPDHLQKLLDGLTNQDGEPEIALVHKTTGDRTAQTTVTTDQPWSRPETPPGPGRPAPDGLA